ncbi:GTP-binding protein [Butyrivibrio sp. XPD2006]|uniref:GTP-binding protein n=1 Tax=Butyrivibrio sp. XPD2006 TaxID=1280668 RepID=UPI0003B75E9D|nr:GTP-binding protein [Butyrivibrio sp. XPD2006]
MKILLISGFLGAGKTTFIKELIRQTGCTSFQVLPTTSANAWSSDRALMKRRSGQDCAPAEKP